MRRSFLKGLRYEFQNFNRLQDIYEFLLLTEVSLKADIDIFRYAKGVSFVFKATQELPKLDLRFDGSNNVECYSEIYDAVPP